MHCPNCGVETAVDRKFCRSCGMNLESISRAVVSHIESDNHSLIARDVEKNAVARLGKTLFVSILVILSGVALIAINKRIGNDEFITLAASMLLLAGGVTAAYAVISPLWKSSGSRGEPPNSADAAATERNVLVTAPQQLAEPFASITDQTTKTLDTPSNAR